MKKTANLEHIERLIKVGFSLTTSQASTYLGLTERTLESYRNMCRGPAFIKVGRSVRYPAMALLDYQQIRYAQHDLLRPPTPQHGIREFTISNDQDKVHPCRN